MHWYTSGVMSTAQQKPFLTLMNEVKTKNPIDVRHELCQFFDSVRPQGKVCPVPGCSETKNFISWGDLYDHFVDGTHKTDFYNLYRDKYHRSYGASGGIEFKHGVMALMLAQLRQPTSLEDASKNTPTRKTATKTTTTPSGELATSLPLRSRKPKKAEVQVPLLTPLEVLKPTVEFLTAVTNSAVSIGRNEPDAPNRRNLGAFHKVAEIIRNSDEINLVWRGKMLDHFIELFHGIPPCFHCRSAEGKQIHHQNPLFHEIILLMLNKLGTTADKILEAKEQGNETLLQTLLREVAAFHMKEGKVLAVPYCSDCNQDAEAKRRENRKKSF